MTRLSIACMAFVAATAPAFAQDYDVAVREYLDADVRAWVNDPAIVAAIKAQNEKNAGISQADIDAMDTAWRAEVGTSDTPTISPVMNNAAADFLRDKAAASEGAITEIFIMDEHGLNVAASDVTSDYWQGDEEKFTETFGKGADSLHVSEVELDESSQTYQAQVSLPVVDVDGSVIGAITVGLDAEALF